MTPREFAQQLEGYRWRDERAWEKCAVLVAHLGWHKQPTSAKDILDGWRGTTSEQAFESLAGLDSPGEAFDAMVARQAERKLKGA